MSCSRFFKPLKTAVVGSLLIYSLASASEPSTFTVTENLTLGRISCILYGNLKRVKEISSLNHLKNPNFITVGQLLKLPDVPTHSEIEQNQEREVKNGRDEKLESKIFSDFLVAEEVKKSTQDKEAEAALAAGEKSLRKKKYSKAVELLRASREKNPNQISAWIEEIKALRESKQTLRANETIDLFIKKFPQFSELHFLKDSK